jgi:1-acyl-sn-glycerol-3-phosphate acyltransferase
MLRLMGVRVRRSGATPVGGVLLAPNHLGYLDVLVLAACRPVVFVAKREVRGWSVVGWLARAGGTRFLDRRRARDVGRAGGEISEALAKGAGVAVFLEGTSTDGRGVAPFHASLLGRAVEEGWLVAPVALVYRVEAGRSVERDVAWWGDMELAPHLWNLLGLRSVEAEVAFGAAEQARGGRKELAEELRQRVASLKEKVTEVGV